MDKNQKYSCTSELGVEALLLITSFLIFLTSAQSVMLDAIFSTVRNVRKTLFGNIVDIIQSPARALFLPLMSYAFSQTKQNNPVRSQVILIWVVLFEVMRACGGDSTWELQKSGEEVVRLLWVIFLVWGYTPLNLLRTSLLVLCVSSIIFEVLKGITFYQTKDSYLLDKNPKLIHDYMKRIMLQDDLKTTPMENCDYIVMGEENHKITPCKNGYHLGETLNFKGKLTVGRVFQLNSTQDEAIPLAHTDWRDTCLSFALAKMLRRRFVNLPLDEAGSSKALQFVLEGLLDYVGHNKDIQMEGSSGERNPGERALGIVQDELDSARVFSIIKDELKFVSELSNTKVPARTYFGKLALVNSIVCIIGAYITMYLFFNTVHLSYKMSSHKPRNSTWSSLGVQDAYKYSHCIIFRHGTGLYQYDQFITILLAASCCYIYIKGFLANFGSSHWSSLKFVEHYIENPTKWKKNHSSFKASRLTNILEQFIQYGDKFRSRFSSVTYEKIEQERLNYSIFGIKFTSRIRYILLKWISRNLLKPFLPAVSHTTHVKDAILRSMRNNSCQLTNGETALKTYGVLEHLNRVFPPSESINESVLVWYIATNLFYHKKPPCPEDNDALKKDRCVALDLSSYCFYLLYFLPELLPEEVDWTEEKIESVKEEIFAIDRYSCQKPTAVNRCNYAMDVGVKWDEKSLVGKGAKLAKELVDYSDNGTQVWTMLSEWWAEMMLFIAPSDNVEGHEEILEKGELITQVWALLTHAGILTRPESTEHPNHGIESNEVTEDMIV